MKRIFYQEDYRKYKHVKKELTRYSEETMLDVSRRNYVLLLSRNQHSNGMKLFLPLMLAESMGRSSDRAAYQIMYHFKHHTEFPVTTTQYGGQRIVSTAMTVGGVYFWDETVPAYLYINATTRPDGDYSHLTDSQQKKKFNGEKAKIAAKEYLSDTSLSKTVVSQKYGISLSTLIDAIKRLKREREVSEGQSGIIMDYKTAPDSQTRKRVASVALLNVLNSPVSPSKRCKLISHAAFKYNIPERTLRDRLKALNPSLSKSAEGIRRRKLTPAAEQFLTTFYAICDARNTQMTVKQADAICKLMAETTGEYSLFNFQPGPDGDMSLSRFLADREVQLGKSFGWRFRLRNGFSSSRPKRMDSNRLNASNVNNIAMWLSDEAYRILSCTPRELIYNADEIGFAHTIDNSSRHSRYVSVNVPKSSGGRGVIYKVKEKDENLKTLTTVTACVSAAGKIIPPMVTAASSIAKSRTDCVTSNSRFECNAQQKLHPEAGRNVRTIFTQNGWNNSRAFMEYIKWFDYQTREAATVSGGDSSQAHLKKRVLIVDNHFSHYGRAVLDYVTENNILLLLLPPNTTHILQPLDVGVFSSFKKQVRTLATEWCPQPEIGLDGKSRYGHFDILCNFVNALFHVTKNSFNPATIVQAFNNAGIYPPEKALFNPAVRKVMKHFDGHAKLKNIFLTNILPLTESSLRSSRSISGAQINGSSQNSRNSQVIPLVDSNAFFIGEEEIESLDYLGVNTAEILARSDEVEESRSDSTKQTTSKEEQQIRAIDEASLVDHDFMTKFTFEDVLQMITNSMNGDAVDKEVSLIPKLIKRLDSCSTIAFSSKSHFTITKEIFLEQQSNVIGIVMYLIYFGACFLGVREQAKIEDSFHIFEGNNHPEKHIHSCTSGAPTVDILRDISKKQFFKLFPKISNNIDRDLFKKLSTIQQGRADTSSISQEVINTLGSTVCDFLKDMLKNEHSVLATQPEELKTRVLNTVIDSPAALAKAATVRTIFGQDGKISLSKNDFPIISKIESVSVLPQELIDVNLTDDQFASKLASLREIAYQTMQDMVDRETGGNSDDEDTLVEDTSLEEEDRDQKLLQDWFLIYHVDNVAARIIKARENKALQRQNAEYRRQIEHLSQIISGMTSHIRDQEMH